MGDGSASDGGPAQATGRPGGRLAPVLELVDRQLPPELQQRCDGFLSRYFKHLSSLDLKAQKAHVLRSKAHAYGFATDPLASLKERRGTDATPGAPAA